MTTQSETADDVRQAMAILQGLAGPRLSPTAPVPTPAPPLPPRAESLPTWSEHSLRELVESLPDAVVVVDTNGFIVLINGQTERTFGYRREELLGQAIEIVVPERLRQDHVGKRDRFLASPHHRPLGGVNSQLHGRHKNGSEFPVEISLSPIHAEGGLLVASVIRDVTERKRHEAKFRTLVENIPAVTFIAPMDDSNPELYVSPQIEQMLGYSQKEWLEDPVLWHRQLHPADRDRWNRHFAPTCANGTPFRATYRFMAKDGRVIWVHGSANLVRDAEGKSLFLQGVAFDVTPIKEAEEERDRFFSISIDLFCVAGLDGYFRRVNQAFTTVLGYPAEELLRRPLVEFVHPDDREKTLQAMSGLARGETVERFENRYRCRDGSYRWLQWTTVPYLQGQICYAAARDVTREKEDEEALREQARLAVLRADISAAITSTDELEGMLQRCVTALTRDLDAAFARIWTFNNKENLLELVAIAGMYAHRDEPHSRVPLGQYKIGLIAARQEAFCTNQVQQDERFLDREWANREGLVAFAGYPLLIEDRLVGVLALYSRHALSEATLQTLELIASQISLGIKRKETEDALRRVNAELERRVAERTEELARSLARLEEKTEELNKYAYHATHDLKEPLRTVKTHAQRLVKQTSVQLPPEAMERVQKVIDGMSSMQVLLEKLREYAHVNQQARSESVDCTAALIAACTSLQAAIEESGARIEAGDLPTVVGMKEHLELLFQNLIGNALKYRSPDRPPVVEVGAQPHTDGWLFWVRDNGMGIEPKYWSKIFEMGQQLNSRSRYGGWGYGLAICEKTVLKHGGKIWVASEPGQGSTFYFTLPPRPPVEG